MSSRTCGPRTTPKRRSPSSRRFRTTFLRERRQGASSWTTAATRARCPAQAPAASNAILIGAKRSRTRHPIFLAGPQVGYFFPELFAEMELSGAGFADPRRGLPGSARSWSSAAVRTSPGARRPRRRTTWTSSSRRSATTTQHYLYRGQCFAMRRVPLGLVRAPRGARSAVGLLRDDPRAGARLRDGRWDAGRDLDAAVDPGPRDAERSARSTTSTPLGCRRRGSSSRR